MHGRGYSYRTIALNLEKVIRFFHNSLWLFFLLLWFKIGGSTLLFGFWSYWHPFFFSFFFYGLAVSDSANEYPNIHYEKKTWLFGGQTLWGWGWWNPEDSSPGLAFSVWVLLRSSASLGFSLPICKYRTAIPAVL